MNVKLLTPSGKKLLNATLKIIFIYIIILAASALSAIPFMFYVKENALRAGANIGVSNLIAYICGCFMSIFIFIAYTNMVGIMSKICGDKK